MPEELSGSCHCGAIQYKILNEPKLVVNCHCNDCRKRNGSAFSTYLAIAETDMNLLQGADKLQSYTVPGTGTINFCKQCGTTLYNNNARYPGMLMVMYGSLNDASSVTPMANVFCESKLTWVDGLANLKNFPGSLTRG